MVIFTTNLKQFNHELNQYNLNQSTYLLCSVPHVQHPLEAPHNSIDMSSQGEEAAPVGTLVLHT